MAKPHDMFESRKKSEKKKKKKSIYGLLVLCISHD